MNLNLIVIEEQLSKRFKVIEKYTRNTKRFLINAMLYSGEPMYDDGTVYVLKGEDLRDEPYISDSCAIVSVGLPQKAYLSDRYNCIVLEETSGLVPVMNELQRIFSRFYNWHERLYSALYFGNGIQAIINEAQKMFENPVCMHDSNYCIIAYAENRELYPKKEKYGFLYYGRLSVKSIQALNSIPGFSKTFLTKEPTYWEKTNNPVDKFNYLYNNLFIDEKYSGRIFIDERVRPISMADFIVLEELTKAIEPMLQQQGLFGKKRPGNFSIEMSKILENDAVEMEILNDALSDLGWQREDFYSCIQIRLPDDDTLFNIMASMCDMMESNIRDSQAFPYRDHIVVIINRSRWDDKYDFFIKQFKEILQDFNLKAGVSLVFKDLIDLQKYYKQTVYALKCGEKKPTYDTLYFFESFTYDYVLDHSISEFSAEMLCPNALLSLINYDRENHTSYTVTLRAYLECDSSPSKTIARLFLHRSTLLYRLNRIQELIDIDLNDINVKLHFLMAFKLLDLSGSMVPLVGLEPTTP